MVYHTTSGSGRDKKNLKTEVSDSDIVNDCIIARNGDLNVIEEYEYVQTPPPSVSDPRVSREF